MAAQAANTSNPNGISGDTLAIAGLGALGVTGIGAALIATHRSHKKSLSGNVPASTSPGSASARQSSPAPPSPTAVASALSTDAAHHTDQASSASSPAEAERQIRALLDSKKADVNEKLKAVMAAGPDYDERLKAFRTAETELIAFMAAQTTSLPPLPAPEKVAPISTTRTSKYLVSELQPEHVEGLAQALQSDNDASRFRKLDSGNAHGLMDRTHTKMVPNAAAYHEMFHDYLRSPQTVVYTVENGDKKSVGFVRFESMPPETGIKDTNISYWFTKKSPDRPVSAREAIVTAIHYAWQHKKMKDQQRLVAVVSDTNIPSAKIAQRIGFKKLASNEQPQWAKETFEGGEKFLKTGVGYSVYEMRRPSTATNGSSTPPAHSEQHFPLLRVAA